jgi:excisionase family DNA binding protein
MSPPDDITPDRTRLQVVLGGEPARYLTVADAARVSGFSRRAVYRAIARGELTASHVCSRLRIHPDDFLAWMNHDRTSTPPPRGRQVETHKAPAPDGLRSLLSKHTTTA